MVNFPWLPSTYHKMYMSQNDVLEHCEKQLYLLKLVTANWSQPSLRSFEALSMMWSKSAEPQAVKGSFSPGLDSCTLSLHSRNSGQNCGIAVASEKGGNSHWSCGPAIHYDSGNPNLYLDNQTQKGDARPYLTPHWQSYCHQVRTA